MSTRPKDLLRPIFDGYKPPPLNKGGGQTVWTKDKEDEIITRIEQGETLLAICRDEHMPDRATFYRWLDVHSGLRDRYANARETQAHSLIEEAMEAVREASTRDEAIIARVRSDLMCRVAGKLNKVYADRVQHNHAVVSHAELIEMAQKVYEAKKLEGKTIDLVPEITATEG